MNLEGIFTDLCLQYSKDSILIATYWKEVQTHYSSPNRHYHNLIHLESILTELNEIKDQIKDWDAILFSVFYHDVIYNAVSKKNEEKSAELAKKRLISLQVNQSIIDLCFDAVIATKNHKTHKSNDINLFTDADLSILGASTETYNKYILKIRKEYAIFPDFLYNNGRKKVLKHFLEMDKIFKTEHFKNKYEVKARENLGMELETY